MYDPTMASNPYGSGVSVPGATDPLGLNSAAGVNPIAQPTMQPTAPTLNYQYPSYPNQFGLGSQNPNSGFGTPTPQSGDSGTAFASTPITVNTPDTTSRGANPWSFIGESNARDAPPAEPSFQGNQQK